MAIDDQNLARGNSSFAERAPDKRLHSCQQLIHVERFGQVIISSAVQSTNSRGDIALDGQHGPGEIPLQIVAVVRNRNQVWSEVGGMHTYDDAFLYVRNREIQKDDNGFGIMDAYGAVLKLMDVKKPAGVEAEELF